MIKPPLATSITALLGVVISTSLFNLAFGATPNGQSRQYADASDSSIAGRETARRHEETERGLAAIDSGDRALKDKDYEKAFAQYRIACDDIPNSVNTAHLYNRAIRDFCDAAVLLAEEYITQGRYTDAETTVKTVLQSEYNPNCKRAQIVLANLETPDYYNKTITPSFRAQVEQVKQLMVEAKGFYDTGRWTLAYKRCDQVLALDPYNIAALKLQEEVNRKKDDYAIEGYNNARAWMLWQLDKRWQRPVRRYDTVHNTGPNPGEGGTTRAQLIENKLDSIIIPKLDFKDATIREAIDFLKRKSQELDPEHAGVNIVLSLEGGELSPTPVATVATPAIPGLGEAPAPAPAPSPIISSGGSSNTPISISLSNIPLREALRYVTNLANLKFKVEDYAIRVVPLSVSIETLITRDWKVPPSMFSGGTTAGQTDALSQAATSAGGRGGATRAPGDNPGVKRLRDAKEALTAQGVPFPPGATATFLPQSSELIVKNTPDAMDLIEALVEGISSVAAQVEVEAKFVEVQQNNNKELSFDWLLGQANVPGSSNKLFFGGGTTGTSTGVDQSQFPFPIGSGATQSFPISSSLRSGSVAISQNAIDALLMGTSGGATPSPVTAAISGVFTDPTFQLVMHALNQKQGVDLLSAPRVTTKSGQRAVIEVIREFRYPTEFEPPQIPQTFGNNTGSGGSSQSQGSFPVTPTTPTAFEVRNTGVTLEVEPVIGPDNVTIDLNLVPQVVEFEGFINYGSPIQTTSTNGLGQTVTNIVTPNVINQPIFSTRKVTTSVSIYDGQTVVLGGLMREDVQKVEDKIPGLGDVPLFGRLFRSNVDQHLKTNLIMFVTARLINASGDTVHSDEEQEEVVQTLPTPEVTEPPLPLMPK